MNAHLAKTYEEYINAVESFEDVVIKPFDPMMSKEEKDKTYEEYKKIVDDVTNLRSTFIRPSNVVEGLTWSALAPSSEDFWYDRFPEIVYCPELRQFADLYDMVDQCYRQLFTAFEKWVEDAYPDDE